MKTIPVVYLKRTGEVVLFGDQVLHVNKSYDSKFKSEIVDNLISVVDKLTGSITYFVDKESAVDYVAIRVENIAEALSFSNSCSEIDFVGITTQFDIHVTMAEVINERY